MGGVWVHGVAAGRRRVAAAGGGVAGLEWRWGGTFFPAGFLNLRMFSTLRARFSFFALSRHAIVMVELRVDTAAVRCACQGRARSG